MAGGRAFYQDRQQYGQEQQNAQCAEYFIGGEARVKLGVSIGAETVRQHSLAPSFVAQDVVQGNAPVSKVKIEMLFFHGSAGFVPVV